MGNLSKRVTDPPKTAAFLGPNIPYGTETAEVMGPELERAGLRLAVTELYDLGITDFSAIISKIKAAKPDMLHVVGFFGDGVLFFKQWKELGGYAKIIFSEAASRSDLWLKPELGGVPPAGSRLFICVIHMPIYCSKAFKSRVRQR